MKFIAALVVAAASLSGCCYSSECCGPQNFGPFAAPVAVAREATGERLAEVPPALPAAAR